LWKEYLSYIIAEQTVKHDDGCDNDVSVSINYFVNFLSSFIFTAPSSPSPRKSVHYSGPFSPYILFFDFSFGLEVMVFSITL